MNGRDLLCCHELSGNRASRNQLRDNRQNLAGIRSAYVIHLRVNAMKVEYRNRPFHPRSISPYVRLERFACLSFLNRLTVSPAIYHNEESTAGVRIERTFSLPNPPN